MGVTDSKPPNPSRGATRCVQAAKNGVMLGIRVIVVLHPRAVPPDPMNAKKGGQPERAALCSRTSHIKKDSSQQVVVSRQQSSSKQQTQWKGDSASPENLPWSVFLVGMSLCMVARDSPAPPIGIGSKNAALVSPYRNTQRRGSVPDLGGSWELVCLREEEYFGLSDR